MEWWTPNTQVLGPDQAYVRTKYKIQILDKTTEATWT